MIVKKLRLQRNWSQEQLAEYSGLSIRTIQRIERAKPAHLESYKSIAAVFEVDVNDIKPERTMNTKTNSDLISQEEVEAFEYVQELKAFYLHLMIFIVVNVFLIILNFIVSPNYLWFLWALGGWGLGITIHAIVTFDWFSLFDSDWEKKQIEKRLGRKL
jgi:transcriptional regulator with XRE-family HTH domain